MFRRPGLQQVKVRRAGQAAENALTFTQGLTRTGDTVSNDLITGKAGGQQLNGGVSAGEGLIISANAAGVGGTIQLQMATVQLTCGNQSINAAAGAQLDAFAVAAGTVTIIGGTPITDARGFNQIRLDAPQIVSGVNIGPGGIVPAGATVKINGVPTISGGGAFAGSTGAVALWVHGPSPVAYFDGTVIFAATAGLAGSTASFGSLQLQGTTNAINTGGVYTLDTFGVGRVAGLGSVPKFAVAGNLTLASAAGATLQYVVVNSPTITVTGATNITTAAGFNFIEFQQPSISTTVTIGPGGAVPSASTLYIPGPPTIAGGGSFAGTLGAVSFYVGTGVSYFGGQVQVAGNITLLSGGFLVGGTTSSWTAAGMTIDVGAGLVSIVNAGATLVVSGAVSIGNTLSLTGVLTLNSDTAANGTGAAVTLPNFGGAGRPTAGAPAGWWHIKQSGNDRYVPFWGP